MAKKTLHLLTITLFFITINIANAGGPEFDAGMRAYDRNDYISAYRTWLPLAEKGDASAQLYIAFMLKNGHGLPQDLGTAVKFFTSAALQGDPRAQYNLGIMAGGGEGMPKDLIAAYAWLSCSASNPESKNYSYQPARLRDVYARALSQTQLQQGQAMATECFLNFKPKI